MKGQVLLLMAAEPGAVSGARTYQVGAGIGLGKGPGQIVERIELHTIAVLHAAGGCRYRVQEEGSGATIHFANGSQRIIPEHQIVFYDWVADAS